MNNKIGKVLCFLGIHQYICTIDDMVNEFGHIPLNGKMPKNSTCKRCGKVYS